jgi:tRNA(fMet)-specific endonuclease VapC
MKYLLDTNACIYFLNGTYPALAERLLVAGPAALAVSAMTVAELHFGAARSRRAKANLMRVRAFLSEVRSEPFNDGPAERFGALKAQLLGRGRSIADFDLAIAATALVGGYTVVTSESDLRGIPGLLVEDWTKRD